MNIKSYERITLSFGGSDTSKSATIDKLRWPLLMGKTVMAVVAIPNWTNDVTLTFKHILPSNASVYAIAGLARNQPINAPVVLHYDRPIYNGCVITCELSGAPGGTGGDVTVDLFLE